jgi:hypothetical protein
MELFCSIKLFGSQYLIKYSNLSAFQKDKLLHRKSQEINMALIFITDS